MLAIADAILSSYNAMGCQVMNIGANDLGGGGDFIEELQTKSSFPFISANILMAKTDKHLFQPSTIIETPDLKLGFVGVTIGDNRLKEFTFSDPVEAANQAVSALRDKVDLVFLLANVDDRTEIALTQKVKGIDFLIRSKTGSLYRNPKEQNGTVIIRVGKQGKFAGVLNVRRVDSISRLTNVSAQRARIKFSENRLNAMSKDLKEGITLEERYAGDKSRLTLISRLQAEKKDNKDLIRKLKNSYYFEGISLNDKIADTPEVATIVAEFMPVKKEDQAKKGN